MKENQSHEARRRAFIREHHPDRGGDPGGFIAGLRALDSEREQGNGPLPEVVVVRRRPWLVRKAAAVVRRLRYGPRPSRVRLPVTACPSLALLVAAATSTATLRRGPGLRYVLTRGAGPRRSRLPGRGRLVMSAESPGACETMSLDKRGAVRRVIGQPYDWPYRCVREGLVSKRDLSSHVL